MENKITILLVIIFLFLFSSSIYAEWDTQISMDKMTGEKSAYATSSYTGPLVKMSFPHDNLKTWLAVGCQGQSEWAYIGFSSGPNLINTETKDGYNKVKTRIKWDSNLENIYFTQTWGAKFLHFDDHKNAISKIIKSNSVLLELDWYGQGKKYFNFSLTGSSSAIKKIRTECKK